MKVQVLYGCMPAETVEMAGNERRQACNVDVLETPDRLARLEHLVETGDVAAGTSRLVAPGRGILVCGKVARLE